MCSVSVQVCHTNHHWWSAKTTPCELQLWVSLHGHLALHVFFVESIHTSINHNLNELPTHHSLQVDFNALYDTPHICTPFAPEAIFEKTKKQQTCWVVSSHKKPDGSACGELMGRRFTCGLVLSPITLKARPVQVFIETSCTIYASLTNEYNKLCNNLHGVSMYWFKFCMRTY